MNSKELFFDDFKDTLWKLLETRDKEEIDKLKKRLREIKRLLKKKAPKAPSDDLKEVIKQEKNDKGEIKDKKEDKKENKKDKEEKPKEKEEQKEDQTDEKPKDNKPIQISRPKGGDPKNVETLQSIQKEKQDDEESIKGEAQKSPKDSKEDPEINKKMMSAIENQEKFKQPPDFLQKSSEEPQNQNLAKEDQELTNERERILAKIQSLKAPTEEDYREEIFTYLHVDHDKSFRTKIQNFSLPFNTRAKREDTNNYKHKSKKDIDKIKMEVQKLKQKREMARRLEEKKKETLYQRNQNIMKRMHEDLVRDKGGYVEPPIQGGVNSLHPTLNKQRIGYQVPRKFTLESLGRMDYRDFNPQSTQVDEVEDDFKPSDVIDSEEDMDEEIEEFYQFKNRNPQAENYALSVAKTSVSAHQLHDPGLNVNSSQSTNPMNPKKLNAAIGSQKKVNHSIIHNPKIKNIGGRLKNSILPSQKHFKPYKVAPSKPRGVYHSHHPRSSHPQKAKRKPIALYNTRSHKSVHNSVSDYSSAQKNKADQRIAKLRVANSNSLVRAHKFDAQNKLRQEQKLKKRIL